MPATLENLEEWYEETVEECEDGSEIACDKWNGSKKFLTDIQILQKS